MPRSIRITSLESYVSTVESLWRQWSRDRSAVIWFRGHADADWTLTPGFYRPIRRPDEDRYRHDFIHRAMPFLDEVTAPPTSDWDWYFLMQHYGLPTRLLDWTASSLVALYFAVHDRLCVANGAVWMLQPSLLNRLAIDSGLVPPPSHALAANYLAPLWTTAGTRLPDYPIAIDPPCNSKRIAAQRGKFTVHGYRVAAIEKSRKRRSALQRLVIPSNNKHQIRRQLQMAGITESVIFPGLSGLGAEICELYSQSPT